MELEGAIGACMADSNSGMMLGSIGDESINLETAAVENTAVVRANRKAMRSLQLDDHIEDILVTLNKQYHLIRLLASDGALFMYLVIDKQRGNLALARRALSAAEKSLVF